jgi:ATP-dependent Clp protease ATP-binding subunit ClpC
VTISDEALKAAANLSARYITDRFLPDKAVDLIDEAASMMRLSSFISSPQLSETEEKIRLLTVQKNRAKSNDDFVEAEKYKNLIAEETLRLEALKLSLGVESRPVVTEETIAQTVSKWTGIPVSKISENESAKLLNLEDTLSKSIIGQNEAVHAVSTALRRARAGLKDPKRPIGSFIFVGSTGVGKSELSKALAKIMFGEENDIINVDMSEYGEANSVNKLIGAPPGFVGYEESGQLTEKVRRRPYSIVLFDEIEKAHPDVFNVFLQILDEGRLTDSKGRVVDFKNTVIIMTSNVGAELNSTADASDNYDSLKERYFSALKRTFKPEFLNRVDDIVVFHPLSFDAAKKIAALFMEKLANRLKENGLNIEFTDSAVKILANQGYSAEYGARPLKRIIQRSVEDKLSEALLSGKIKKGDKIIIDGTGNKILFKK